jgi:hypothetical protein
MNCGACDRAPASRSIIFIEAVMMVGLIQYEGITGSAVEDMRAEEAEEQFLMDWMREEDEDIDLNEQFPEEEE